MRMWPTNSAWCLLLHAFLVAVLVLPLPQQGRGEEPAFAEEIDRLVQPYLDESIVVGMVVGAVRGEESSVRGYGRVRRNDPAKPDGNTVYEIGSVTKTFTGLLLADAVTRGDMRLDQPAARWLPGTARMPRHADRPITLADLATHVSGLPRLPANLNSSSEKDPYADYAAEDLYAFLKSHTPQCAPAVEQEYSNLGFGLLGQILAEQAGKDYEQLVRSVIATPLGMHDTGIELTESMRSRLAPPHGADLTPASPWRFQAMAGAGALRSTAEDMIRYARAHLDPPDNQLGEAIELAWRVHQPPIAPQDFAMGLGWHLARDGITRWHNGQTGGYHAMLLIDRPRRIAVVVLSNTATMQIDPLAEQLVRLLAGAPE